MFQRLYKTIRRLWPYRGGRSVLRSKQISLLRVLAVARSENLDPKTLIQNLAAEYPDSYGQKLISLQRWIAADSSISAALAHTPGVLSDDDILAIQCGIETGTLDETLKFLVDQDPGHPESNTSEIIRSTLGYVFATLCFAVLVVTFLMVFIVPTFEQMFEEFALELPPLMLALIVFCREFAFVIPILILIAFAMGILFFFEDVRRALQRSMLGRLLPGKSARRKASLLRLFALPTSIGQPLATTVTAAAQHHSDRNCRQRLLQARTDSTSEADLWNQLARQGLITRNQGEQIVKIVSPSLRSWALETLADRTGRRGDQKNEFLARVLQHVPIIILGLFVGWIALAVMQTLTSLIQSLA